MATSSKVMFKLSTLREEALKSIDDQIAAKVVEVERLNNVDLSDKVELWRADQESRLQDLVRRLGNVDDATLARFRIDKMPSRDDYERDRAERELAQLQARRTKILAKSESLVADADGNISLTKTQLAEFFGL